MLVTLKQIMKTAEERNIAIGAFNSPNLESLLAIIDAAEELELPVILQFAQCHECLIPLETIGPFMVRLAEKASVPVCVHLDHGETFEYLGHALEMGFTSIMYDGSQLSFEENVKNTQKAVQMAGEKGASVEAELGSMGKRESGHGHEDGHEDGHGEKDETKVYTDKEKAKEFVDKTGIDALACSFGTTHGIYLSEPKLNFQIVEDVRVKTNGIPIVMHGGSGIGASDYRKAILAGVRKINYFTYMDKSGGNAVADYIRNHNQDEPLFFSSISLEAKEAMKKNVMSAMNMFALRNET